MTSAPRSVDRLAASPAPAASAVRDVYVIAKRGEEILLLLRSGTGYRDGEWGPPSGKVEADETYAEAALRELAEETGIILHPGGLRFLHVIERASPSGEYWVGLFFEVDIDGVTPENSEPHKHSQLGFFRPADLPDATVDYVRHVLDGSRNGMPYSTWPEARRRPGIGVEVT